jgi:hypothetical protein
VAGGGATVTEVEQGEALEHPRWRGHPPGKRVEAAAHRSFLPMGRVEKSGMAAAFSDEVGAPVAGGVLRRGGEGEEAQAQVYPEKKRQGGARGSAHRGGVHDGEGGRTMAVARSDRGTVLGQ